MSTPKDPKNPMGWYVGQPVIMKTRSHSSWGTSGKIIEMKRTRMTVRFGTETHPYTESFLIIDGCDKAVDTWTYLTTQELLDEQEIRAELKIRLKAAGLEFRLGGGMERKISTPDLRELVELAERIEG